MEKITSLAKFYTPAGSDGRDKSHLCISLTFEGLEQGFFRIDPIDRLAGTLFGGQGVFYQNDEGVRSEKNKLLIYFSFCVDQASTSPRTQLQTQQHFTGSSVRLQEHSTGESGEHFSCFTQIVNLNALM